MISVKVDQLAFPTDKFPCFGFPVCIDNAKLYLPEYDDTDTVNGFEETVFETMYLFKCNETFEINIGDDRTYTYMFDKNIFVLGTREQVFPKLRKALNYIQDAPFSKLEIAELLNMNDTTMRTILDECFTFLSEIDIEQAEQWALEKSYCPKTKSHIMKKLIRQTIYKIKKHLKLIYSMLYSSLIGAVIVAVLGGIAIFLLPWDALFMTLVGFAVIDYIVSLIKANIFKELSISVGLRGLIKLLFVFVLVAVGTIVDRIIPEANGAIRIAVMIFFIVDEGISILNNTGEFGLPLPKSLKNALHKLSKSEDKDEDKNNKNGT